MKNLTLTKMQEMEEFLRLRIQELYMKSGRLTRSDIKEIHYSEQELIFEGKMKEFVDEEIAQLERYELMLKDIKDKELLPDGLLD